MKSIGDIMKEIDGANCNEQYEILERWQEEIREDQRKKDARRYDNLEGAYREEQQWAIKLKVEVADWTARFLQAEQGIKLALEVCSFPVGAMKAKRALEAILNAGKADDAEVENG